MGVYSPCIRLRRGGGIGAQQTDRRVTRHPLRARSGRHINWSQRPSADIGELRESCLRQRTACPSISALLATCSRRGTIVKDLIYLQEIYITAENTYGLGVVKETWQTD